MESTLTNSDPTCPREAASAINASINAWNTPALAQALNCSRTRRGNGPVAATSRCGSINAHSASVRSKRATPVFYQPHQHTTWLDLDPNPEQRFAPSEQ
ncbi:hypothetical protein [Saccharothrix sp. HUAS TT1]|uniref:hypothetical protein n=1 Tax=unclassified Saccharothrix TaxID=2593673 RepID=UPI00345C2C14